MDWQAIRRCSCCGKYKTVERAICRECWDMIYDKQFEKCDDCTEAGDTYLDDQRENLDKKTDG